MLAKAGNLGSILGPSPAMIRKLAHLCYYTDDLERMLRYYRDGLGLKEAFRFTSDAGEWFGVYLQCGDSTFLEIFDRQGSTKQWGGDGKPLTAGNQYGHLCFEVTGLEGECERLRAQGVTVGPITVGMDHSKQAWSADPDGNKVEFMEYTHRSWQFPRNAPVTKS